MVEQFWKWTVYICDWQTWKKLQCSKWTCSSAEEVLHPKSEGYILLWRYIWNRWLNPDVSKGYLEQSLEVHV